MPQLLLIFFLRILKSWESCELIFCQFYCLALLYSYVIWLSSSKILKFYEKQLSRHLCKILEEQYDDNFVIGSFRPSLLANCKLQGVYLQMKWILICTAQLENIPYRQKPWDEILALFENLATNQSCLISNQLAYRLCPLWGISIISKAIEPFISYCICKKLIARKKWKTMHNESNFGNAT